MQRVYLIPGFFGFANLGDFAYFGHVLDALDDLGLPRSRVHIVPTHPTASLPVRASRLLRRIQATAEPHDRLHLIGHSSGGLDARLLTTPGVRLPGGVDPEPVAQRVASVTTVATPHRGTPSADVFTTLAGRKLLRLLSVLTIVVLRRGGVAFSALIRIGDIFNRIETRFLRDPDLVDALFRQVAAELSPEGREAVTRFFSEINDDQGLLPQLMPAAAALFDATTTDRPGVPYGCVVTRAHPPGLRSALRHRSPSAIVAFTIYTLCWTIASRSSPTQPWLSPLRSFWGDLRPADNDGMVPTCSQVHGKVLAHANADHLDILGHFADAHRSPPHFDWLTTGSGYRYEAFHDTWARVACFIDEAS